MTSPPDNGMMHLSSPHTFQETLQRLQSILQAPGIKVFCTVDHSGEAEKAGLKMEPTQVVIFGNPKAGTPVMVAAPTLAIDLPLKALIRESEGKVWVSYNSPEYMQNRHNIPEDLLRNISAIGTLLQKVVAQSN